MEVSLGRFRARLAKHGINQVGLEGFFPAEGSHAPGRLDQPQVETEE